MKKHSRKGGKQDVPPESSNLPQHTDSLESELQLNSADLTPGMTGYDAASLSQAKTYWFFGEWNKLATLDLKSFHHHPDRDRFALLVASAHQQLGAHDTTRKYIRLALEWGCPQSLVAKILIAGVHNTLGKASAINKDEKRTAIHFRESVRIATDDQEADLVSHARSLREMTRLGLLPQAESLLNDQLDKMRDPHQLPQQLQARIEILESEAELLHQKLSAVIQTPLSSYRGTGNKPAKSTTANYNVVNETISTLARQCLQAEDIHDAIDQAVSSKGMSSRELFFFFVELADRFIQKKDRLTALHFLEKARTETEYDTDEMIQTLLAKRFVAVGRPDFAVDIAVQATLQKNTGLPLARKEKAVIQKSYENIRAATQVKATHGHDLLLTYLQNHLPNIKPGHLGGKPVIIEIGTTREDISEQGSTRKIAEFCKKTFTPFYYSGHGPTQHSHC